MLIYLKLNVTCNLVIVYCYYFDTKKSEIWNNARQVSIAKYSFIAFWREGVGTSNFRTSTGQKFQNIEMVFLDDQNIEIRTSKMSFELIWSQNYQPVSCPRQNRLWNKYSPGRKTNPIKHLGTRQHIKLGCRQQAGNSVFF
jgi:hypothetical protein